MRPYLSAVFDHKSTKNNEVNLNLEKAEISGQVAFQICALYQLKQSLETEISPYYRVCSTINLAENSDQPKALLFHPTGITVKFDVKKL